MMDRSVLRKVRRRAVALGALAALLVPACASEHGQTVATVPPGMAMPPTSGASGDAPKADSAPPGYPWATGASLPTNIAKAPGGQAR
jgi:hypothetical protein